MSPVVRRGRWRYRPLLDAWHEDRVERTAMPYGIRVGSIEADLGAPMTSARRAHWSRIPIHPDQHDRHDRDGHDRGGHDELGDQGDQHGAHDHGGEQVGSEESAGRGPGEAGVNEPTAVQESTVERPPAPAVPPDDLEVLAARVAALRAELGLDQPDQQGADGAGNPDESRRAQLARWAHDDNHNDGRGDDAGDGEVA